MSLGKGMPVIHPPNRRSTEVQRNRTAAPTTLCQSLTTIFEAQGYGHQDTILYIKTTKAQFSSKRMVASPAANEPNI
jgi:hypothetical protein